MADKVNVWYVYILLCADDSLYVGHTEDVDARLAMHNAGRGALHTARHLPVRLLYSESLGSEQSAVQREKQIKKWSREKKEALIKGDLGTLKKLSVCRGQHGS